MTERPQTKMDVVCSDPVGIPGAQSLLTQERERLLRRYTDTYLQKAKSRMRKAAGEAALEEPYRFSQASDAEAVSRKGYEFVESDGSGGIYGMLWRLAEQAGVGLRIDLKSIPILQETIEICNMLDRDPYMLTNSGMLYLSTDGQALCRKLHGDGYALAAVIGQTSTDRKRLVRYDDTERFLTRPEAAEPVS